MDILVSIRLSEPKLMLNCPVPLWYEHGNAICPSGCSRSGADHNDMIYLLSLSIGIVAGLRAMTAPAAVSWAAYLGWLKLDESILAFMGYAWTPWVITVLAVAELVTDQLPSTPSRAVPIQFGTRILSGALTGAALGIVAGSLVIGAVLGATGAVIVRSAVARPAPHLHESSAMTALRRCWRMPSLSLRLCWS
jgi:uncharacterized membrane protein